MNSSLKNIIKYFYESNKFALFGLIFIIIISFVSIFANFIAPFDPDMQILELSSKNPLEKAEVIVINTNNRCKYIPIKKLINIDSNSIYFLDYSSLKKTLFLNELKGNSESEWHKEIVFLLGTDRFGRDVLSRLIYGGQISLTVGIISQSIAIFLGLLLGSISGFYKGIVDKFIMWLMNVIWAFPSILLVIAISVVLGKGYWQAFVAIGLTSWVDISRIVRGQVFSIREQDYIESSRSLGFSSKRIIIRHILPNTFAPVFVASTVGLASAIIFEASLSFLGLGVQPPTASWGQMIFDGYKYIITGSNWGLALLPIILITCTVVSVNLVGDGLRDFFDPKLKNKIG